MASMSHRTFADVEALFTTLGASPTPAVVWYGPGGERTELSGRVLENWVAKTANLLVEELDAAPGSTIALRAPAHWRSLAVGLAAVRTGLVQLPRTDGAREAEAVPAQVWVGFEAEGAQARTAQTRLLLARGALAASYDGASPLDADAVDYAASVRSFADSYDPFDPLDPELPLEPGEAGLSLGAWLDRAQEADQGGVVLGAVADREADPGLLADWAGLLADGGTLVLLDPRLERQQRERALAQEGADAADHSGR